MSEPFEKVPALLREALVKRGITQLTQVQLAVLADETAGRDLRISSQTGSGKTVAFGFAIARALEDRKDQLPAALIITPTRELAAQVATELSWLLAATEARVVTVTGGTSVRGEQRALKQGADVVVGTPGRLVDHLTSKALDASSIGVVVLDEADEMLDMGFRESLQTILDAAPAERRTHLVSATFPREVLALANRYQKGALEVQGTRLGVANADITHVIHRVAPGESYDVVVNILALAPNASTLVFTRTREGTSELSKYLQIAGFSSAPLSGEMDQRERTRTLDAFREGRVRVLVATDVAARGIDLPEVTRIVHADAPEDADTYTHRSGRTARAGRKGESLLLIPASGLERAERLLHRARVKAQVTAVPTPEQVARAAEARLRRELATSMETASEDASLDALAAELIAEHGAERLVAHLLDRSLAPERARARAVTVIAQPSTRRLPKLDTKPSRKNERPRPQPPRTGRDLREGRAPRERPPPGAFVRFRVTWGNRQGADPRRLLALACRRGGVESSDIGAIDTGPAQSIIEVRAERAREFAEAAARPDARDPRVRIFPDTGEPPQPPPRKAPPPPSRPSSRKLPEAAPSTRKVPTAAPSTRKVPTAAPSTRKIPTAAPSTRRVRDEGLRKPDTYTKRRVDKKPFPKKRPH